MRAGVFEAMAQDLRALFRDMLHGRHPEPTAVILDSRTVQSTPESGARAAYDGYKRRKGSKIHAALDTLGNLLALHVTPANEQDREQVGAVTSAVEEQTGKHVTIALVDQGYTGQEPAEAAAKSGVDLCVVKPAEAKRGFVLLPKRWAVERSFVWASRFRRLGRDCERLALTLAGLTGPPASASCWRSFDVHDRL